VAAAAALVFFGVQTLGHQKVDVFPEFAPVSVEIQTECLGLSPSEVEQLVTVPLENALQGVARVKQIQSESVPQLSAIFLYFDKGTNVLEARRLVQERITAAAPTLPSWAAPPSLYPIVSATSRVIQMGMSSKTLSPLDLSNLAQYTIRPRLLHVPGVANVAIWGEKRKQINVEANPSALVAKHVSLNSLMNAAGNAVDAGLLSFTSGSTIGTGGFIDGVNQRLPIHNVSAVTHPDQLAATPLGRQGGKPLRISDVAHVAYGHPPLIGDAVVNGGRGLMLVIEKFPDANTLDVSNGVDRALAAMKPGLPGVHLDTQIFRQSTFIHTAIHNLSLAVLLGCILVVFVLIAFLFEWRAALVSLVAIPLSLAAAAIVLDLLGATINTMILAGFAVSVGVVVDDAIIDTENIVRRLRAWRARGRRTTPLSLLLAASLEVRTAILYATLINIVAVLPVVFVGGLTGSFFQPLAMAYGLAVLASMALALTVTPALAMILLPSATLHARDPWLVGRLKRGYTRLLRPVMARPRWAAIGVTAAIVVGAAVLPTMHQDLFPSPKERNLLVHFNTQPGASLPEMKRAVGRLQKRLLRIPGVTHVGAHIGQALLGEEIAGTEFSEQWISLDPKADLTRTQDQVRAVAASFPGTSVDVTTYLHERINETISNATEDLVFRISGPEFGVLQRESRAVTKALAGIRGLIDTHPQSQGYTPQIEETVRAAAARRYGLTPGAVRRDAAVIFGSQEVGEVNTGGPPYTVTVGSVPSARRSLSDVRRLLIDTPGGGHVPLGKVAGLRINSTPSDITRKDGASTIDVLSNVSGADLGSVTSAAKARLAKIKLPLGYHVEVLGAGAERAAAQNQLLLMGAVAVIAVLFLLQAAFASIRLAGLMFATLPVALVGGVLAAWTAVGTISLGALVGLFTVLGIAARNGILMISHFRHLEEVESEPFGLGLVMRGAAERLSPILMTALATALALAPLVINGNRPGQEIEHPMAIVILGGMLSSTLLNLFLLPALYLRFGRPRPPAAAEAPATLPAGEHERELSLAH
jgi:CzcA family heavy metal efflux pump